MGLIESAKTLMALARSYDKKDLYQHAVELMAQITEQANENFKAAQEIQRLEGEVAALRQKLKLKGQTFIRNGVYFLKNDNGHEEGPFCTRCWEADDLLIHVDRSDLHFYCRNCETGQRRLPPLPAPLMRKPTGW